MRRNNDSDKPGCRNNFREVWSFPEVAPAAQASSGRRWLLVCVQALLVITSYGVNILYAQRIDFTYKTYGLEVAGDNVIQNAHYLDDFFEDLFQLKQQQDRKINIVHIGDSHI